MYQYALYYHVNVVSIWYKISQNRFGCFCPQRRKKEVDHSSTDDKDIDNKSINSKKTLLEEFEQETKDLGKETTI